MKAQKDKKHIKFFIEKDRSFDVVATNFTISPIGYNLCLWNGVMDRPIFCDFTQFIDIQILDRDNAGTDDVCYNNLRRAFDDFGINWEE